MYDPNKITLKKVLISFWEGHDPTQGMRQGNDIGTQYRSAIFITNKEDLIEVKNTMKEFQGYLTREGLKNITTEITGDGVTGAVKYNQEGYYVKAGMHSWDFSGTVSTSQGRSSDALGSGTDPFFGFGFGSEQMELGYEYCCRICCIL